MKKRKKKIFLIIVAVIVLLVALAAGGLAVFASYQMSLIPTMSYEDMLAFTTKDEENAIITVGIINKGAVSYTVYGKNSSILPNEQYQYEIGSITKTFTTSLLSKAISEGKADIDSGIDIYLDLPTKDYYPTLKKLVTHTSGYKGYYFEKQMITNFFKRQKNDFYNIDNDTLSRRMGKVKLIDKNYDFEYSNFGISVVGSVISSIYEDSYENIMNAYLEELEFESTRISNSQGNLSGYWNWQQNDAYIPAGGLISTIDDMIKYLNMNMTAENDYLKATHTNIAEVNGSSKRNAKMDIRIDAMGMGWILDTKNNLVWHNGGTSEFNSYIAFDKEKQIGVVILSNLAPNFRIPATVMGVKLITTLQKDNTSY